jgi:hypothetical protein
MKIAEEGLGQALLINLSYSKIVNSLSAMIPGRQLN